MRPFIGTLLFLLCTWGVSAQEPAEHKFTGARLAPTKKTAHKVSWITVGMPVVVVAAAGMLVATQGLKGEDDIL